MTSFRPEKYQELAIDHLKTNEEAVLYMGCGMGKTATCLATAVELFLDGRLKGVLVVAPLRVANVSWPDEVEKFEEFSWMTVANLRTKEGLAALAVGGAHIYTINYESLPKLGEFIKKTFCRKKLPFNLTIFDELTLAKNFKSKRIQSYRNMIRPKVDMHWGLTGTPLVNDLLDLYGQIRLIDGGVRLGKSFGSFKECYFFPTDYMRYNWDIRPDKQGVIEEKVSDLALSLRREEYLDLPDIVFEDINVTMSKNTKDVYNRLRKDMFVETDDTTITADSAGVLVQKLLQLTGGGIYDDEREVMELDTAKVDALEKLVKKLKEPVLVGANFIHEQERIRKRFPKAKFMRDCATEVEEHDLIRKWNQGKIPMLVSHPKSIGHGLNLQAGGRFIVWYTLPWSRELYDQFNCRLSRKGQGQEVKVFRLMNLGTIDDAVAESLRTKLDTRDRFQHILEKLEKV